MKRLEALGFLKKESVKSNPTRRKFLLTWLSDPTYLPPIREPKAKSKKKGRGVTEAEVKDWARKRVRELVDSGHGEEDIYEYISSEFSQANHTDEEWVWVEEATEAAMADATREHADAGTIPQWEPGDRRKPTEPEVAR